MTERFDVLVLGAGIVGVSTALHLQRRGRSVALIDRRGPGEETSYGNAGVIEASSVLPYAFPAWSKIPAILSGNDPAARADLMQLPKLAPWLMKLRREGSSFDRRLASARALRPLLQRVRAEHKVLMAEADATRYLKEDGWVRIYRSKESFEADARMREIAGEFALPIESMDAADYITVEPHLKPNFAMASWLKDTASVSSPGNVTKAYAAHFVASGGNLVKGDAKSLRGLPAGGWSVAVEGGEQIVGTEAVVTLGPWSMDVLGRLGYRFPLGIKRGYHKHFKAEGNAVLNRPVVDVEKGYAIAPMERDYRITTGAEFTDRDAPPNPVQVAQVLPLARELFPLGDAVETDAWMGRRPCFPDSLPIVDRAWDHKGLWLNFGHGHLGFTLGPITGRLIAEMMTGEAPVVDPLPYRATRF
jgi:D-amino-acid dehydrogenase